MDKEIGVRLAQIRKAVNLSQLDFAKRINRSQGTVSGYEKGLFSVTDRAISDICREFKVSEDWLRNGIGPMFRPAKGINNELTAAVASLVASEDAFTKKVILKYLQLPDNHKKIFEKFLTELIEDVPSPEK